MKHKEDILELLQKELGTFGKLERDWGSYGEEKVSARAIKTAETLLDGLFVCPTAEGGISISLGNEEIIVEVHPDGEWDVFVEFDCEGCDGCAEE